MDERIEALLFLASHGGEMLHASTKLLRKVDAVRRAQGRVHSKMKQEIESKERSIVRYTEMNNPEALGDIIDEIDKECMELCREMDQYECDSDVILEWLRRTDPDLYAAAVADGKTAQKKHLGCNCTLGAARKDQEREHRAWVNQLERQFYDKEEKCNLQTRSAKKRAFEQSMQQLEEK